MANLSDLQPGQRGIIRNIFGNGSLHQRLREMGMMEGFPVELIRFAPLGDPLLVSIQGYQLSLRKAEASLVEIHDESNGNG